MDLKYRGQVYFEPVCIRTAYWALHRLKSYNNFFEDISIKGHSNEDMFEFSDTVEI